MLLDTSGLFCLIHEPDRFHELAIEFYVAAEFRLTHNYVVAELVALAEARKASREITLGLANEIHLDPKVEFVWVDEQLHAEAVALLLARRDKTYSLCDAVSFILMRRYQIVDALSTDQHFEQEGFHRLLK